MAEPRDDPWTDLGYGYPEPTSEPSTFTAVTLPPAAVAAPEPPASPTARKLALARCRRILAATSGLFA